MDKAVGNVNGHLSALFVQKPVTCFPKQQDLHSIEGGDTEDLVTQLC